MSSSKEKQYLQNIQRSLVEVYSRIEILLYNIPNDIDEEDLTPSQLEAVAAVQAIEEEWVLDEKMRKEMSCIDWS